MVRKEIFKKRGIKFSSRAWFTKRSLILTVTFMAVGAFIIMLSHAATPSASIEPEDSTITTGAATQSSDLLASGGKAVKFGGSVCGKQVSNYTYQMLFGHAPWNIPACNLPLFANNKTVAESFGNRLFNYALAWDASSQYWQDRIEQQKGKFTTPFGLTSNSSDQSTPVYHATTSATKRFMMCDTDICYPSNLEVATCSLVTNIKCMAPDYDVPFDTSWKPSGGNDHEMIIIDDRPGSTHGFTYELAGVDFNKTTCAFRSFTMYTPQGKSPESRICVSLIKTIRDKDNNQVNIYNYDQGITDNRGLGIYKSAMLVTPEEVQAGEIRHAMDLEVFNVMFGPACDSSLPKTVNASFASLTCGYALSPAAKFEWRDARDISRKVINQTGEGSCENTANRTAGLSDPSITFRQLYTMDKTIPEGMRFRLTISNDDIENWLDSRAKEYADDPSAHPESKGFEEGSLKRETARIFAVALRDYGFVVGDQTCSSAGITIAGGANPDTKTKWANLGIADDTSSKLLFGLFTAHNMVALNPPTSTCLDGSKTQLYCKWTNSSY